MAQVFHKPNQWCICAIPQKPDIVTQHLRITDGQLAYVSGGTGVVPQKLNLYGGTQLFHLRYVKLVVAVVCSEEVYHNGEGTLVSTEAEVSYATIRILDRSHGTGGCMLPQDEKGESKYYGKTHCFGT